MLKALLLGAFAALALAAAVPQAMAQADTFVIVPDNPGGGGGNAVGGNAAVTSTTLNVRAGPGTEFQVLAVLHHGQKVRIVTCEGNWCWINQSGPDGWVNQNHLVRTGGGGGNAGPSPPPPAQLRGACFYEQERFRGRAFCASAGDSDHNLGSWNNRIRSIRINGLVTVQVCTDRSFFNCNAFNRNQSSLPRWLSRNISAFRIFH